MTLLPQNPFAGWDARTLINQQAERLADKVFLTWEPFEGEPREWTYAAFADAVRSFAAGLTDRGVDPGDRVLVHLENCPESIIAWLGCAYGGAVAVMTNSKSTADELAHFVSHSRAVAAVTQSSFVDAVGAAFADARFIAVVDSHDQPAPRCTFDDIAGDASALPARPADPMAPFAIQYTSGTTSRPKAVLWTHGNFLWGAKVSALHEDLRADDVHLVHLPLFHTNAQIYSVAASMWAGASIVLMPRFSVSRFWPISLRHRCTWTSMVPFCIKAIASQPVPDHHYRFWGGGVCEPHPVDKHFKVKTLGWWGMTETVTHGTVGSAHLPDASMSIGRPSPAYEIHVLDENGHPVAPGEVGDLHIRGHRGISLFLEYAQDPEATAAAFRDDNLMITGDRVRVGTDGFLYFVDRAKDMLKVGGENVSASEVERVIAAVDGVSEVAVVAGSDPMLDEVPVAFVIARAGIETEDLEARIRGACDTQLSPFKRPRAVRFVDDFPRATLGKVAKAELRSWLR